MTRNDTEHLLASPNNAKRLRDAIRDMDAGKGIERELHQLYDPILEEQIPDDLNRLLDDLD